MMDRRPIVPSRRRASSPCTRSSTTSGTTTTPGRSASADSATARRAASTTDRITASSGPGCCSSRSPHGARTEIDGRSGPWYTSAMDHPIAYVVDLSERHAHLFGVEARFPVGGGDVDLKLPVWTPGSYLVREFARHVQDLVCDDGEGG